MRSMSRVISGSPCTAGSSSSKLSFPSPLPMTLVVTHSQHPSEQLGGTVPSARNHGPWCTYLLFSLWKSSFQIDRSLSVALVEQWLVVFPCSPCTDTPETATWGTATCAASPSPPVPRSSHRSSVRPCFGTAEVHCSCRSATWACSCAISLRAASSARLSLPSPAETPASCPPTPQDPVEV